MMPNPEQDKVLRRCAAMLKRALGGIKRIIFDLAPENHPDSVHYEIHGKIKLANEDEPCKVVNMMNNEDIKA